MVKHVPETQPTYNLRVGSKRSYEAYNNFRKERSTIAKTHTKKHTDALKKTIDHFDTAEETIPPQQEMPIQYAEFESKSPLQRKDPTDEYELAKVKPVDYPRDVDLFEYLLDDKIQFEFETC